MAASLRDADGDTAKEDEERRRVGVGQSGAHPPSQAAGARAEGGFRLNLCALARSAVGAALALVGRAATTPEGEARRRSRATAEDGALPRIRWPLVFVVAAAPGTGCGDDVPGWGSGTPVRMRKCSRTHTL